MMGVQSKASVKGGTAPGMLLPPGGGGGKGVGAGVVGAPLTIGSVMLPPLGSAAIVGSLGKGSPMATGGSPPGAKNSGAGDGAGVRRGWRRVGASGSGTGVGRSVHFFQVGAVVIVEGVVGVSILSRFATYMNLS